jgi:protein N-terminal amidase
MDLNPHPPHLWASSAGPFELADFSRNQNCRLLILLCNWLDSQVDPETSWDIYTINYWIARLRPLWDAKEGETLEADQERIVVICNRVGVERGKTHTFISSQRCSTTSSSIGNIFAGSSIIFRMSRSAEEPECVGVMRRNEEAVKTWAV